MARLTMTAALAGAALLGGGATAAMAASAPPRWDLTAVPSPTKLVPGSPRSEVDILEVKATGGTYRITMEIEHGYHTSAAIPYDATATEVRETIDRIAGGQGASVLVSEESGSPSTHLYKVSWAGSAEDHSLQSIFIEEVTGEARNLEGTEASVTITPEIPGVDEAQVIVTATDVGGATDGSAIKLEDVLPAGLIAGEVQGVVPYGGGYEGAPMACTAGATVTCEYSKAVDAGSTLVMVILVKVAEGLPATVSNEAIVQGGGAGAVELTTELPVNEEPVSFGIAPGSVVAATSTSKAGAHANITTAFAFTTSEPATVTATPKDVRFNLPVGFVGNTVGMPRCSMHVVATVVGSGCPVDTMVGMATVILGEYGFYERIITPVYNIAPAPGEPAAFGFNALVAPVRLDTSVLSNGDYGVQVEVHDINEGLPVVATSITMWGVPSEMQGVGHSKTQPPIVHEFGGPSGNTAVPLLTNPQQCTQPLDASLTSDSWLQPGVYLGSESVGLGSLEGCDQLLFSSSFTMVPDTLEAGVPAGYHFGLEVPQNEAANGIATPNVRNVRLTLPEGTVVNPSAAWGLKACSAAQFYGPNHPSEAPAEVASCPRESQVGQVWIKTPALEEALEGDVFLAEPECDPCSAADAEDGKMVKLYVQAVSEGSGGIVVKLEGKTLVNAKTGQITTVFEDNPQLPFSALRLKLAGGPRAVLANPRRCGSAVSSIDVTPWSAPETPDSKSSYGFEIDQNCFGPQFHPTFKAGMPNIEAGAHGEFTLAFGRSDDDQFLKQITMKMPPGLLGTLTGVELCREAQAIAGTCGANSEIGTTEVLTGPGANPFLVEGGKVFLSEGYGGSQFGLSIVVPAVAGPYTLGGLDGEGREVDTGTVVVRAQLYVDPHTAQLTVVSGALPSMLDGIPLQLKAVNVRIDRPGFTFNPTSCEKMSITGTIASQEGMSANVASPFQVTNCAALPFKPGFKASTKAKHTRKDGAYLHVTVESGSGQADIGYAKVALPKALPSELKTLQHACTEAQFNANPAGCPAESDVGTAEVNTPVVPVPLAGPAYFVSRGAQWPELIMVLQGYGVTVDLNGETHISEGVTTTTLSSVPDVPFTRFSLTLPEKEYSALAGNGDLCAQQLVMPIRLVGQNGRAFEQNTNVEVQGCSKTLAVRSHRVKKGLLILRVYAPAAGRLQVSGKGLKTQTKQLDARKVVTLKLAERQAVRLKTKVNVVFTPSKGKARKRQVKRLSVKFKAPAQAGKRRRGK